MQVGFMKDKATREFWIWFQYLLIGFVAAMVAFNAYLAEEYITANEDPSIDINARDVLRVMWNNYLLPWVTVFLVLSALRFLILFVLDRVEKNRLPNDPNNAA